jgi:hypothetical protein
MQLASPQNACLYRPDPCQHHSTCPQPYPLCSSACMSVYLLLRIATGRVFESRHHSLDEDKHSLVCV